MARVLLVHGDSDGVCSAALALRYYRDLRREEVRVVFSHPAGLLQDLVELVPADHDVFIADIALPQDAYERIVRLLGERAKSREVVYVDHHPLPEGMEALPEGVRFVYDPTASASELTYRMLEGELGEDYSRVFLFGAVADYLDETEYARKHMELWDKRAVYFEAGVLSHGLEASRKMYDFKRRVVEHLAANRLPSSMGELVVKALVEAQNEEEMRQRVRERLVRLAAVSYVIEPGGSLGRAANYARLYGRTPVGVAVQLMDKKANMSVRSDRSVDVNVILRRLAPRFGGTGGGHPQAAGARVPRERLEEFLRALDEEVRGSAGSHRT